MPLQVLIISILMGFTLSNNDNESTLLLHINSQMNSLEIMTHPNNLVSNSIINSDFKDMGIYKIELWCKFADDNDLYNGNLEDKIFIISSISHLNHLKNLYLNRKDIKNFFLLIVILN